MSIDKRRRYIRYEIKLAATLVVNSVSFIQCVIRDFCSGGLFLEPLQQSFVDSLKPQQKIQIFFTVGSEHEDFSMEAAIMHVRANGVGVEFLEQSDAAFQALKKEVENDSGVISPEKPSNPTPSFDQKKLETDLVALLQKSLSAIIRSFHQRTVTKLKEESELFENLPLKTDMQDVAITLELNQEAIFESFYTNILKDWDLTMPVAGNADKESSLSLVDRNDFEDWLDLLAIIRNLESVNKYQLEQFQKKMAYLIGVEKNQFINPACPEKICVGFRDILTEIEGNDQVKRIVYALFEETLLDFLPDLYLKIDAVLITHGAPEKFVDPPAPSIRKSISETKQINAHSPQPAQAGDLGSYHPATMVAGNNALMSTPPGNYAQGSSDGRVTSHLLQMLQGGTAIQHMRATTKAVSPEYSANEISSALAQLQKKQNITGTDSSSSSVLSLQKGLLGSLNEVYGSEKKLSITDKNNVEVYESLFDTLYKDLMLSKDILSYLKRIHLPVMDQAMQDSSFLESGSNPARKIVNHISSLEPAIKDNTIVKNVHIRQTLDHLTDQIANQAINNPAIFDSVELQLKGITEYVNETAEHNIKRVTDVYEGKQKLEKARLSVEEKFDQRLGDKKIAKIIVTLLDAGWQNLLVIAQLNKDNHAFQSRLHIINNLNDWLSGSDKASKEQVDSTIEYIDTELKPVCSNAFLHNKILNELESLLLGNSVQPGSDAMEMVKINKSQQHHINRKSNVRHDEVELLNIGEWLTFLIEKKIEPLKLVWIGEIDDVYVFVNRSGVKKLELKQDELADLMRTGSASKIESLDEPIMDRATNIMLQKMQKTLVHNAVHDPVTLLLNRKEFIKQLKQELSKFDNAHHLLCNIEIQDFRVITNTCGLEGGDALIKELAEILKNQLRKNEIIARLDDKTFSILLKNCSADTVDAMAKKLQYELINSHFKWQDKSYSIAVSMGIVSLFTGNTYSIDSVLHKVDSATLLATKEGRNHIRIYKEDDESIKSQYNVNEWVGRIDKVFADNRLFLRCQKIVAIDPEVNSHTHYEILLGITDENGNIIAPDDFIPAVERCQRMSEVDKWVVLAVFSWIEQHPVDFDMLDGFSINLSGESVNSPDFLDFLKHTLTSCKIPLEKITFEITETVAAGSFEFVQMFIKQIKHFKCKFSLDDFGSGYSSYSYLKKLDVDYLKIDGEFVKDILTNSADVAIVKSMNEIGHALGLKTIAEYVENDNILALLKEVGVDYVQGWGIQKPIRITDLA